MEILAALITLTILEVVLGIDNIIFISILAGRLPQHLQQKARLIGLSLAMMMRILLLLSISFIMKLTQALFSVLGNEISGRDIILIAGGLFLIAKSTFEIHDKLEGADGNKKSYGRNITFSSVIIQIILVDLIFSLDSVITAVGMTNLLWVMITAVVIAVIFMMIAAKPVSDFVHRHPTVKILALSFLLLIGVSLIAEGLNQHIPKGYIYFAMAFSVFVEMINIKIRTKESEPVELKQRQF